MKRVTIKDIAAKLGVNASTVSRALHNHPDVSTELKTNIKKLADKMGYRPNLMAVNLRHGQSKTIGLIVPEISMFFLPSVMKAIEEKTHLRGYNLLVLHSNDSLQREMENAELCLFNGVAGVLVSLTKQSLDIEHFSDLEYANIPVVYFDKALDPCVAHKVMIPSEPAAYKGAKMLMRNIKPDKRICGIFGDERLSITQERIEGFKRALKEDNYYYHPDNIFFAHNTQEAYNISRLLWQGRTRPDGIFMMSDEILAGVLRAVNEQNIDVPNDLQLISMSDGVLPGFSYPIVPFIETSGYRLGEVAVQRLFDLIDGKAVEPETIFIDTPYVAVRGMNHLHR